MTITSIDFVNKFLIFFIFFFSTFSIFGRGNKNFKKLSMETQYWLNLRAKIKIRLSEIDAPELNQPFGTNSKFCLSELFVNNEYLKFKSDGQDGYGRSLGWLMTDEINLNYEMLKKDAHGFTIDTSSTKKFIVFKTVRV